MIDERFRCLEVMDRFQAEAQLMLGDIDFAFWEEGNCTHVRFKDELTNNQVMNSLGFPFPDFSYRLPGDNFDHPIFNISMEQFTEILEFLDYIQEVDVL